MVGRSISLPQLKVAPSQMGPVGSVGAVKTKINTINYHFRQRQHWQLKLSGWPALAFKSNCFSQKITSTKVNIWIRV